jgi:hypothetical protein
MAKEEKKDPNIPELVEPSEDPTPSSTPKKDLFEFKPEDYISILNALRNVKKHITVAPTATPKTFFDQIQFLDDGVDLQVWIWVNGTWRYVDLT